MADKINKIREWVSYKQDSLMDEDGYFEYPEDRGAYNVLSELDDYIDSMQEEPVSKKFAFKAIPRLLEMIEPTDRAKAYIAKLADTLELEGYSTDAKIVRESLKIMNGEKVPMATMDEELVSEDLEEAAEKYAYELFPSVGVANTETELAFKAGAKWQKENLWKYADGDDLPEIDREVVVLLNNGRVAFGHRPPEYWEGKDIITGKVTRNYVERYDKGLWNIPNVKYWLDVNLPKQED